MPKELTFTGSMKYKDNNEWKDVPTIKGESGVVVSETEPVNENDVLWVNPTEDEYVEALEKSDIVQNTESASADKIPSAAVTHALAAALKNNNEFSARKEEAFDVNSSSITLPLTDMWNYNVGNKFSYPKMFLVLGCQWADASTFMAIGVARFEVGNNTTNDNCKIVLDPESVISSVSCDAENHTLTVNTYRPWSYMKVQVIG